jgi:branched-chain amino acid transport system permease protein
MVIVQNLINGLLLGGLYAAVALGFSLVWGVMNVINLAHGAFIMIGAYVTYWCFALLGIDPFLSVPLAMAFTFALGYLLQRYIVNLVVRTQVFMVFILTFGVEILLQNVTNLVCTADFRSITTPYSGAGVTVGGILIPYIRLVICGAALLLTFGLNLFLNGTKTGNAIRATSLNQEGAQLVGVDIGKIYMYTFAISAATAGAAGALMANVVAVSPYMGGTYTFKAALIVCLGGLGSIPGVVAGGMVVGLAETMGSHFISPGYKEFISFVLLVLILIVRPEGIMGKKFYAVIQH